MSRHRNSSAAFNSKPESALTGSIEPSIAAASDCVVFVAFEPSHDRLLANQPVAFRPLQGLEHAPVVFRHDFEKPRRGLLPESQELPCALAVRVYRMALEQFLDFSKVRLVQTVKRNRFEIAAVLEVAGLVEDISHAAGHSRGKIPPRCPDDNHAPTGHVFATVVADAFHHRA